ncbi:MAG TPA: PKD domain-containing protein [Bryobacteraceae bacterium]|nr:PKD domain-containing protein [Bryobacteraceae bacterium]
MNLTKLHTRIVFGVALFAALQHVAAAQPFVGGYKLISETRVDRTKFDYTYRATLTNPGAAITNATAALTSLAAATVVMDGSLTFGNAPANSAVESSDTFTIRQDRTVPFDASKLRWDVSSQPANRPPVANAGPDQNSALTGSTVALSGAASTDPDGDTLSFTWSVLTRPAGSTAQIANSTQAAASFIPDRFGAYTIQLTVNDGKGGAATDTLQISTHNRPPVANAGPDQSVALGATVALNGAASSDLDGQPLSYAWTLKQSPSGSGASLSNPTSASPQLIVDKAGAYRMELVVFDGIVNSAVDEVVVTTLNSTPVANAGPNQTVAAGNTVQLNGSASSDADGDLLTYAWLLKTKPAGSNAALSNTSSVNPTFIADKAGAYTVELTVSDGKSTSAADQVQITTTNTAPVANAGPDQAVQRGATVQLNGSGSTDADGNSLTYLWSILSAPSGSSAVLSSASAVNPTFAADRIGEYVVQLVVNDGLVNSAPDTLVISTSNTRPVANAGPDQTVQAGANVVLTGIASSDANNDPLTWEWSFQSKPSGSSATLSNANTMSPTFLADRPGQFVIQLRVNDGLLWSDPDTITVSTTNSVPVANAGPDQTVTPGASVFLNGLASNDPDNNPLTYSWSLITKPTGSAATLSSTTDATPSFTADLAGAYVAQLTVSDGFVSSAPDTVMITVNSGQISLALLGTTRIGVGREATIQVTLPSAAPAGGVSVNLTADNAGALSIGPPATLQFAAGTSVANVKVTGLNAANTILRANGGSYQEGTLNVSVTLNLISTPTTVNVAFGQTTSVPISIAPDPAPVGGLTLDVVSNAPGSVQVLTSTVTIPAGQNSANAIVKGLALGTATISVTHPMYAGDETLATTTGTANIVEGNQTFSRGFDREITIQLESQGSPIAAPAGGLTVHLTASAPECLAAPASIHIAQGTVNAKITLSYGGTASLPCTSTLTTSGSGLTSDSINVTVNPTPAISQLSLPTRIGAGLQDGSYTARLATSAHGGVTVRIQSGDPAKVLIAPDAGAAGTPYIDVPIANGSIDATYYVQVLDDATGSVTITATAEGFTDGTGVVNIAPAAIKVDSLSSNMTSFAVNDEFVARIGINQAGNNTFSAAQAIRVGGQPRTVTFSIPDTTVGKLVNAAGEGTTRTALILPGTSSTPTTVAAGGVAFDPVTPGATSVTVAANGLISSTGATQNVTVTGASVSLLSPTARIGAGLQDGSYTARLGASTHGGVTVRVESMDPTKVLIARNASSVGAAFQEYSVASGSIDATYHVQVLEGAAGAVQIKATADGFTESTATITIVPQAIRIEGLSSTLNSLAANDEFSVRIGIADVAGTAFSSAQAIRVGGVPVTVSVALQSANPEAGRLVNSAGPVNPAVLLIAPGQSSTPSTVATGGIAFDPLEIGSVTLMATAENVIATTGATQSVTVTGVSVSMLSASATIGAGLQDGSYTARLGSGNHGGTSVRITSADPSRLLVAPNANSAGSAFIDVPVANGAIDASFYLQALEGTTGSVSITASSSGFTSASMTATIAAPTLRIDGLSTSHASLAANDDFTVSIGSLTSGFSAQSIRFGGVPVTVSLSSSVPGVGRLVTNAGSGATAEAIIVPGKSATPNTVAAGGLQFDPLTTGSTVISAAAPNVTTAAPITVSVTGQSVTLISATATVGAGLQDGGYTARLGVSTHGGTTVRIESSDPSRVLLAPNATTPGAPFVEIPVANGSIDATYYVQAVEGASGTVTLTVSAPGFTNGSGTVTVVPAWIRIQGLATSMSASAANDAFTVQTGYNTSSFVAQAVRAGAAPLAVTVTSTVGTAGTLVTSAGPQNPNTVLIQPGQNSSAASVAAGGIAFDPLGTGNTSVSAAASGLTSATSVSVTVTP